MTGKSAYTTGFFKESMSVNELCVAGACMGYLSAPNLKADILGCPGHSLRVRTLGLLTGMERKGLLQCSFDKRPIIDKKIGQFAAAVCDPEQFSLIKWNSGGKTQTLSIYMRGSFSAAIDDKGSVFRVDDPASLAEGVCASIDLSCLEPYCGENIELLFDELKYAKKLADAFQESGAEQFLSKCTKSDDDLSLIMKLITGKTSFVIMNRWQKRNNHFSLCASDYVAIADGQLIHIKNHPNGSVRFSGADPDRLGMRIEEYCSPAGVMK